MFIVIDGPNGSGKTTVARALSNHVTMTGLACVRTREPSSSKVGKFARRAQEFMCGTPYACLIASDRHHHVATLTSTELKAGRVVISDRYLGSSLVLQELDGVDRDFVWTINKGVPAPHLYVILQVSAETLGMRLARRSRKNRFERSFTPEDEVQKFNEVAEELRAAGYNVIFCLNEGRRARDTAAEIWREALAASSRTPSS